jgi:nitrogenase molybdenum-iron protein NifN
MPMGSVFVFRGIEGCMPLFHGSQGCSTYMRLYLSHHFREPVDIASSALSEKGAVYGGAANLKQGLKNVIAGYGPKAIGIATTCLAETIGDDVPQIVREFGREPEAKDVTIWSVSTPSYKASHEEGYRTALKAVVQSLAKRSEPNGKINLLLGSIVSPADVRYLKRLLGDWGQGYILLPDIPKWTPSRIASRQELLGEIRVGALRLQSPSQVDGGGRDYPQEEFDVPHFGPSCPGPGVTDMFVEGLRSLQAFLPEG